MSILFKSTDNISKSIVFDNKQTTTTFDIDNQSSSTNINNNIETISIKPSQLPLMNQV